MSDRAGQYIPTGSGYRIFHPKMLPIDPPLDLSKVQLLLSEANVAVGRLDSISDFLPNPGLFIYMYVRKEAVLSSQIEGTQASLDDLLEYESGVSERSASRAQDVDEVVNYLAAVNHGLDQLRNLPLSMRLLKEVHGKLLAGVRGEERAPGEVRRQQNWIGPQGAGPEAAIFVPPPADRLPDLLTNLEKFLHADDGLPTLVRAAVAHAQFETIHPFFDGNGRLGRLLITLLLCERKVLREPLLYLSAYFKQHRSDYYDWLMRVRDEGDWEGWLDFFLTGVRDVSNAACATAREVMSLQKELASLIAGELPNSTTAPRLLDLLYTRPILAIGDAAESLQVTFGTASNLMADFERLGLVRETTGRPRNRVYRFHRYLEALTPQ